MSQIPTASTPPSCGPAAGSSSSRWSGSRPPRGWSRRTIRRQRGCADDATLRASGTRRMNDEVKDDKGATGTGSAPHPVLTKYYERESDRRPFVSALFDNGAKHYDWINSLGSMGSGRFYRRWILTKTGLRPGMTLLDVATGTGLVAQAAAGILRESGAVVGLDPSIGMLRQAQKTLAIPLVQGRVEELPFATGRFDFLSMGYALRHMADLGVAFRQCLRVLKPGGRILILELTPPRSAVGRSVF